VRNPGRYPFLIAISGILTALWGSGLAASDKPVAAELAALWVLAGDGPDSDEGQGAQLSTRQQALLRQWVRDNPGRLFPDPAQRAVLSAQGKLASTQIDCFLIGCHLVRASDDPDETGTESGDPDQGPTADRGEEGVAPAAGNDDFRQGPATAPSLGFRPSPAWAWRRTSPTTPAVGAARVAARWLTHFRHRW